MNRFLKLTAVFEKTISAFLLSFILLSMVSLQAQELVESEDPPAVLESPQIITRTLKTETLPLNQPQAVDLQLVELPGAPSDLAIGNVTLKAYMRTVDYQGQLIGQVVLTGVEQNGVTIPLNQSSFNGQFDLETSELTSSEPVPVIGNSGELIAALQQFSSESEEELAGDIGEAVSDGSAGTDGTSNDDEAAYSTPSTVEEDDEDPVVSVVTTTDGCDVRVDIAQGVAIQQSKTITYEDSAITNETECSDTLDRYALQKSYSVCQDNVDLEGLTATAQYVYYYVDSGASRHDVTDCADDEELVFPITEDVSGCTVDLDFNNRTATEQSRLIYYNRNSVETQVQGCEPSDNLQTVDMVESSEGCSISHDFIAEESNQLTSWTYQLNGLTYQALPCSDSEIYYAHEAAYTNSAGNYLCEPIVNIDSGQVTLQSKTRILVDGVYDYITECEPDTSALAILSTTDGCTDMADWTHDVSAGQSYGQHRFYYVTATNEREYVSNCQDSDALYYHQSNLTGYQHLDDQLAAYQLVSVWIESEWGTYTILNSQVKEGSQLIPYALIQTTDVRSGINEYMDNSCDALRLTDLTEIYERPDGTTYNKIIGEGTPITEHACASVSMAPIWEWTGDKNAGKATWSVTPHYRTQEAQKTGRIYSVHYASTVSVSGIWGQYQGVRKLVREDGIQVTQTSMAKYIPKGNDGSTYRCNGQVRVHYQDHGNRNFYYTFKVNQSGSEYYNGRYETKFKSVNTYNLASCPNYRGQDVYEWNQAEGW